MKTYTTAVFGILLAFLSALSYAQAPVPFVNQPLVPDATAPGGPQFTLTVNGTGFVSNSVVNWNGTPLTTQFVSSSQLTAVVPVADIAKASTASVTVVNPAPGGGTSNVAFFTVTYNTGNSVEFTLGSSPVVGTEPLSVAVGDFNGDGKPDLAVANYGSNTVSVLLGDGTGNFTLASSPGTGAGPTDVVTGDFNGDGKLDLAVANYWDGTVSILLGDGKGNFTLASSPSTDGSPNSVAVGDFNGDGKLDLAVGNDNCCSTTVSILLGDGTGNFTLASSVFTSSAMGLASVAVGDFNADGNLDVVTTNYEASSASILLGDGTGNFTLASSPSTGVSTVPRGVVVADFNGDGKLDMATANSGTATASIMLGDGTGNFTLAYSPRTSGYDNSDSQSVAMGDFNGDGILDLAVANLYGNFVSILLGVGTGNFTLYASPYTGGDPYSVAVGDFNGDGKLDLAVANAEGSNVYILLGVPPVPAVTLSPTSLTFGAQLFGTSSLPQTVTLTNTGGAPLNFTHVVTSANFSQTSNCPRQLVPGGTCTANVVFTPRNVNTITGTMTITDNAANSPQTVSLSGVGFAVTLLPSSLDFGNQSVGATSQPQTVTLTNYASEAVTISGGHFSGTNPGSFGLQNTTCQNELPAGASCTINIVFAPKSTGSKAATLEVNDNGGLSPQTVALSGTGTN